MPESNTPFLDDLERHIAQTAGDFRHQHITEVTYRFCAEDPARFAHDLSLVSDCDAIVLVGPDVPAVKLAINDHVRAGVHVATLFTDVAGSMRQAFVGADNRAAGRTAGLLLARMARLPQRNQMLLLSQTTRMSGEIERRIGFVQVIEERFADISVERLLDIPFDDADACDALTAYFSSGVDLSRISGAYCVGVATTGIARALAQAGLAEDVALVAHDLTAAHQAMLIQGSLAYVLHQDIHYCVLTAARVLRGLCENVRGVQSVVQPRVEIFTAENLH
jgi:LacI family transcriptional regulator